MNKAQLTAVIMGALVMTLVGLFPPWMIVQAGEPTLKMGYAPLWKPPIQRHVSRADLFGIKIEVDMEPLLANSIDWAQLLAQWASIGAFTFGAVVLLGNQPARQPRIRSAVTNDQRAEERLAL